MERLLVWRRLTQILFLASFTLIPILDIFRIDADGGFFLLLGRRFFMKQAYLLAILFILMVVLLVLAARSYGRIFCGWLCSQNSWAELGDRIKALANKKKKGAGQWLALSGWLVLAAATIAYTAFGLLAYLMDPTDLLRRLLSGELKAIISIAIAKYTVLAVLDLLLIGHNFCHAVCPYAIFQRFLSAPTTMRVAFDPAMCSSCRGCDRSCFMGLDPRNLVVDSCINCGDCLIACHKQAERRGAGRSLTFSRAPNGLPDVAAEAPAFAQTTGFGFPALAAVVPILFGILVYGFVTSKPTEVVVTKAFVNFDAPVRTEASDVTNRYLVRVSSLSKEPTSYRLDLEGIGPSAVIRPSQIMAPALGSIEFEVLITLKDQPLGPGAKDLAIKLQPAEPGRALTAKTYFTLPN